MSDFFFDFFDCLFIEVDFEVVDVLECELVC